MEARKQTPPEPDSEEIPLPTGAKPESDASLEETAASSTPPPVPAPEIAPEPEPASKGATPVPPSLTPAAAAGAPTPALARPGFPWRRLLERINLLPPKAEGENAEIRLAMWWTTRIGLVLLVIASIFLAVYLSRDNPWMRVLAFLGLSVGVTWLGAYLERRLTQFGRLLSSGGLALFYFTSYAASALPATQVIHSPLGGIAAQVVALAILALWSLWKKDQRVASMAVVMGYATCWFSHGHDLHHLSLAGLLLLAGLAGFFFTRRGWLAPLIAALAGSYAGYVLLALGEWRTGADPGPLVAFGVLGGLAVIFEVSQILSARWHPDALSAHGRRYLAPANTAAAALAGYLTARFVYSAELSDFYLGAALLVFAFAALRHGLKDDSAITTTFFLKASGLLCLFLATRFSGPVEWLAIGAQAGTLLWAAKRSGSRWIEIAAGVVFCVSGGSLLHDLYHTAAAADAAADAVPWPTVSIKTGIAGGFLVYLAALLGLHARWYFGAAKADLQEHLSPAAIPDPKRRAVFRTALALALGFTAWEICLHTEGGGSMERLYLGAALAIALAAPALFLRRAEPTVAGATLLVLASGFSWMAYGDLHKTVWGIALYFILTALCYLCAELARRFWPAERKGSDLARAGAYALGLITAAIGLYAGSTKFHLNNSAPVLTALPLAVLVAVTLVRQSLPGRGKPLSPAGEISTALRTLISALGGILLTILSLVFLKDRPDYVFAWLGLLSLIPLAAAFRTRDWVPSLAGGIPFGIAFLLFSLTLMVSFYHYQRDDATTLSLNIAALLGTSILFAIVLWRKVPKGKWAPAPTVDFILHGISLCLVHEFIAWILYPDLKMDSHGFVLALDGALAIAALLVSSKLPFHHLRHASFLPFVFGLLSELLYRLNAQEFYGPLSWFDLCAFLAGVVFLFLYHRLGADKSGGATATDGSAPSLSTVETVFGWLAGVAVTLFWLYPVQEALDAPWRTTAWAVQALALALLWRRYPPAYSLLRLNYVPLLLAAASAYFLCWQSPAGGSGWTLFSILLTAAIVLGVSLLETTADAKRWTFRRLSWPHAVAALALAFLALWSPDLGYGHLATVWWGVSASVVFVSGLVFRARPYRLVGLAGLMLCILRMFIVDIDDTLNRIFAFFAVSIVLLIIGYLYHRFRKWIAGEET